VKTKLNIVGLGKGLVSQCEGKKVLVPVFGKLNGTSVRLHASPLVKPLVPGVLAMRTRTFKFNSVECILVSFNDIIFKIVYVPGSFLDLLCKLLPI